MCLREAEKFGVPGAGVLEGRGCLGQEDTCAKGGGGDT